MNPPCLIRIENVRKSYPLGQARVHALRGLNLNIAQGEFTAVLGASGSGKSTLLNLVGCLDEPDAGKIWIENQDVSRLGETQRSRLRNEKIGFIFQSFNLIPVLNVYENVELPLLLRPHLNLEAREGRVKKALADVGLGDFLEQLPDKLSGGQRQRVAIARALVTEPSLVLADEPTANLDSTTAHRIIDLLLSLNRERKVTFLFCTHDEKLIERVSRTVRIKDGLISETETPFQVIENEFPMENRFS